MTKTGPNFHPKSEAKKVTQKGAKSGHADDWGDRPGCLGEVLGTALGGFGGGWSEEPSKNSPGSIGVVI